MRDRATEQVFDDKIDPMRYVESPPPPDLANHVRVTWIVEGAVGDPFRVAPDACTDLIVSGGGRLRFNGPMTVGEVVALRSELNIGVTFRPGSRLLIDGSPSLRSLRDSDVVFEDAGGWDPLDDKRLLDFVRQLRDEQRIERHPVVDQVLLSMEDSAVSGSVLSDVYRSLGVGERQVQRLFDRYVGLTPKQTLRVLRQSLVTRSLRTSADGLAKLAGDAGYSDQAHLTREYRSLVGLAPARYRREIDGVGFVQDGGSRTADTEVTDKQRKDCHAPRPTHRHVPRT
jgi:AraC-like DNA-binding protein